MVDKYKVITLCGSTRFKDAFMKAQKRLTLEGNIVISVGLFGHSGDDEVWEGMSEDTLTKTKEMLDDMHKRRQLGNRFVIWKTKQRFPELSKATFQRNSELPNETTLPNETRE